MPFRAVNPHGARNFFKMRKSDEFRVEEITGKDLCALTYELRYRVWSKEAQLSESVQRAGVVRDEHEAHARHWAAFSPEGTLVASARLCIHGKQQEVPEGYCYTDLALPSPVASINRLVVEQCSRNRGIALKLDVHRIEAAKNAGAGCIVAAPASDRRIQALEKLGFLITSFKCKCSYKRSFPLSVMVLHL